MPYLIAQSIREDLKPMWGETTVFSKKNLFSIEEGKLPPVHYDSFTINSHSTTHVEAEKHVRKDGKSVDHFFERPEMLCGAAVVVKLPGDGYVPFSSSENVRLWKVTKEELETSLRRVLGEKQFPGKILLTSEYLPLNEFGSHDPDFVMILSEEAANFLVMLGLSLYGTTWKSSDYMPGSAERPIHKILLKDAAILENLDLRVVPEGVYFLSAFPLMIEGASESPCCPVLFTKEELLWVNL